MQWKVIGKNQSVVMTMRPTISDSNEGGKVASGADAVIGFISRRVHRSKCIERYKFKQSNHVLHQKCSNTDLRLIDHSQSLTTKKPNGRIVVDSYWEP